MVPWTAQTRRRSISYHRPGWRFDVEVGAMAMFTVVSGSFLDGPGQVTARELRVSDPAAGPGAPALRIPASQITSVELPNADGRSSAVITSTMVGALTLGISGAISNAMLSSQGGEITFVVRLADGRWFKARAPQQTLEQLVRAAGH
jgi:hypothetical protein